jgi:hypothetical protein
MAQPKLSEAMVRMLTCARDDGNPFAFLYASHRTRQWHHGGASKTYDALVHRGLLEFGTGKLTEEGQATLKALEQPSS